MIQFYQTRKVKLNLVFFFFFWPAPAGGDRPSGDHAVSVRSSLTETLGWVGMITAALAQSSRAHTYSFHRASDPPHSLSPPLVQHI